MFSFLHSAKSRMLNNKKAASTFPLNAFVIKNDLIFLCVCFGLEASIAAVFLKSVIDMQYIKIFKGNSIRKVQEPLL